MQKQQQLPFKVKTNQTRGAETGVGGGRRYKTFSRRRRRSGKLSQIVCPLAESNVSGKTGAFCQSVDPYTISCLLYTSPSPRD